MIQYIAIKNFKSIKDAQTRLPEHVSAVVGLNGVGKTNLIQSVNFVRSLVMGENTLAALTRIALTPKEIFNYNESSPEIYFGLVIADLSENKYLFEVTLQLVSETTNLQNLVVKHEALYKYREGDVREPVYRRDELKLSDQHNADIPLAVEADKLAISLYQNPDVLAAKGIFAAIAIPDQDAIEFRESIVKAGDKGLAGLIVRLRQKDPVAYDQFIKTVKRLLPTFSAVVELSPTQAQTGTPETEKPYMVLLEEANLKGRLSVKSLSAGDLRTLYIIASVMNLPPGSTFIIEEAENGLHPKRLTSLLDHLDMLSMKRDIQIIYSTHSPIVINKLKAEDVIFVEKDTSHGTRFHVLSDTEHVTNIKKLLEDGVPLAEYMYTRMLPTN
jgi:ABC-type cobalamin/Fe3+-siderophores transport system ATPase subunit